MNANVGRERNGTMRKVVIPLTFALLIAGAPGLADSTRKRPMGRLGRPIGSYLTIEGHRLGKGMNPNSYLIDTVNVWRPSGLLLGASPYTA